MTNGIEKEMKKAVNLEAGSINGKAFVKANNSLLNVTTLNIAVDGSVDIDGKRAGKILAPEITKTFRTGGVTA